MLVTREATSRGRINCVRMSFSEGCVLGNPAFGPLECWNVPVPAIVSLIRKNKPPCRRIGFGRVTSPKDEDLFILERGDRLGEGGQELLNHCFARSNTHVKVGF